MGRYRLKLVTVEMESNPWYASRGQIKKYLPPSCPLGFPLGTERKRNSVCSCWAHFLSDGRQLSTGYKSRINIKIKLTQWNNYIRIFFFFCTGKGHCPSWSANVIPCLFPWNFKRLKTLTLTCEILPGMREWDRNGLWGWWEGKMEAGLEGCVLVTEAD